MDVEKTMNAIVKKAQQVFGCPVLVELIDYPDAAPKDTWYAVVVSGEGALAIGQGKRLEPTLTALQKEVDSASEDSVNCVSTARAQLLALPESVKKRVVFVLRSFG